MKKLMFKIRWRINCMIFCIMMGLNPLKAFRGPVEINPFDNNYKLSSTNLKLLVCQYLTACKTRTRAKSTREVFKYEHSWLENNASIDPISHLWSPQYWCVIDFFTEGVEFPDVIFDFDNFYEKEMWRYRNDEYGSK